jgi:hypothetical protein
MSYGAVGQAVGPTAVEQCAWGRVSTSRPDEVNLVIARTSALDLYLLAPGPVPTLHCPSLFHPPSF